MMHDRADWLESCYAAGRLEKWGDKHVCDQSVAYEIEMSVFKHLLIFRLFYLIFFFKYYCGIQNCV